VQAALARVRELQGNFDGVAPDLALQLVEHSV
jgi:hypothetical protein